VFKLSGADISIEPITPIYDAVFKVFLDNIPVIFDMSDFDFQEYETNLLVFKRTYTRIEHNKFPLGPFMVMNHSTSIDYESLLALRNIKHKNTKSTYYNQREFGPNKDKRSLLTKKFGGKKQQLAQTKYWEEACAHKYNIFIPGANDKVLDRAPSELMFLGKTIVHPKISVYFPYFKKPIPNEHYINVDASISTIPKLDTGKAAKDFYSLALPKNLTKWWYECI
jgi:hypothetical protein